MDWKALFIIIMIFGITTIVATIYAFEKKQILLSFEQLYSKGGYVKISKNSSKAGKVNSPFLENQSITETMISGAQECNRIGNMFPEDGFYNERRQ